jgi:hypothetical protein
MRKVSFGLRGGSAGRNRCDKQLQGQGSPQKQKKRVPVGSGLSDGYFTISPP